MNSEDVIAAIETLRQRQDIPKLLYLNQVRHSPDLAASDEYRRQFNHYYRLRLPLPAHYQHFYAKLEQAAAAETPPSLADILQDFWNHFHARHLSFGSRCGRPSLTRP